MFNSNKEFLKTYEISGKIIELINTSNDNIYIITPYLKPWIQLERTLEIASNKNKRITFILRAGEEKKEYVKKLHIEYGFEVFIYEYLHLKLYLANNVVIMSSMNLYDSSNEKNIEIGIKMNFTSKDYVDFKKNHVFENIFLSKPLCYFRGRFDNEYAKFKETEDKANSRFEEIGFCVICGKKIDHIKNPNKFNPVYTRCNECYYKNPELNSNYNNKVSYCYICGKKGSYSIGSPFHDKCIEEIKAMRQY